MIKPIPYNDKRNTLGLTEKEIDAVGHYRDLNHIQEKWSVDPNPKRKSKDCDVINGYYRGTLKGLGDEEVKLIRLYARRIQSAISKSSINSKFTVYKGVEPFPKLKNYQVGKYTVDKGFSSFSASLEIASTYAKTKKKEDPKIIFVLVLDKGDKALYIDEKEEEWLIPRGSKYHVSNVELEYIEGVGKAMLYYLTLA